MLVAVQVPRGQMEEDRPLHSRRISRIDEPPEERRIVIDHFGFCP